jgi:aminotransferase
MSTVETKPSRVRQALSARAASLPPSTESPFFELQALAAERPNTIKLGMGQPDIPTPKHIVDAAKKALDEGQTVYTAPAGLIELREAIAEKLQADNGLTYDPATEIIVTTGAQEAIAVVMQTLLDPGDEVLIASPFYSAYATNITMAGGVPVGIPTYEKDDYQLTPDAIVSRITDRTKLLAIVSPNNPTASAFTPETMEAIAETAVRHDLAVVSDELYEKVTYDGFVHVSLPSLPGMRDRTILINGFSKSYSMTGFRIGYIAGPADYISLALEPRHTLSISSPTPFQYAALAALKGPQDHFGPMMEEYTRRRNAMAAAFDQLGVTYSLPRGAFYFWANVTTSGVSSLEFCRRAVLDHGLLIFPGSMYGDFGDGYIRISFLAEELDEALRRFKELYKACQDAAG